MKNNEEREIRVYLIRAFLIVLVSVVVLTLLVALLERHVFMPLLSAVLTREAMDGFTPILLGRIFVSVLQRLFFRTGSAWNLLRNDGNLNSIFLTGILLLLVVMGVLLLLPGVVGAFVFAELISRQMRYLERSRIERQQAYEERRYLMMSNMAHDLRTPITSIRAMADALQSGLVDAEQEKVYLEAISRKSVKVAELVSILFEYTKLNSEGFELRREELDLTELLREEAACLYTDVEENGMELTIDLPDRPVILSADPAHLRRLVSNLLINAIRHNPKGTEILLRLSLRPGIAQVYVADTGTELTGNVQELFEPFVRGDGARTTDGGSGLGLSISKKVAELHGFRLGYAQPYGTYTKAFLLTCPLAEKDGV
ncbi:MAG: HAMP domain-containing histidine kinase [Lachnospiraceae bacterium]|nr:HAMP domain-containing histidine kinase [Lachnospiraceae bacterium]